MIEQLLNSTSHLLSSIQIGSIINLTFLLLLVWGVVTVINDKDNPIEWWHFFASKGPDGTHYGDPNKLGILVGIVASSWVIGWQAYSKTLTWEVFGLWLIFIGGVEAFSKWSRIILAKKYSGLAVEVKVEDKDKKG